MERERITLYVPNLIAGSGGKRPITIYRSGNARSRVCVWAPKSEVADHVMGSQE